MSTKSTIATDRLSPHFGHHVVDLDEERWVCATCDPLDALEQWAETFDAALSQFTASVEALRATVNRACDLTLTRLARIEKKETSCQS